MGSVWTLVSVVLAYIVLLDRITFSTRMMLGWADILSVIVFNFGNRSKLT